MHRSSHAGSKYELGTPTNLYPCQMENCLRPKLFSSLFVTYFLLPITQAMTLHERTNGDARCKIELQKSRAEAKIWQRIGFPQTLMHDARSLHPKGRNVSREPVGDRLWQCNFFAFECEFSSQNRSPTGCGRGRRAQNLRPRKFKSGFEHLKCIAAVTLSLLELLCDALTLKQQYPVFDYC